MDGKINIPIDQLTTDLYHIVWVKCSRECSHMTDVSYVWMMFTLWTGVYTVWMMVHTVQTGVHNVVTNLPEGSFQIHEQVGGMINENLHMILCGIP